MFTAIEHCGAENYRCDRVLKIIREVCQYDLVLKNGHPYLLIIRPGPVLAFLVHSIIGSVVGIIYQLNHVVNQIFFLALLQEIVNFLTIFVLEFEARVFWLLIHLQIVLFIYKLSCLMFHINEDFLR